MGLSSFSKSKKEHEVNETLIGLLHDNLFNEAINLKRYYEYNVSDRAIQIEKEYIKYLTIILSGAVMIQTKNYTKFRTWNNTEFNSIVFNCVYKNCAFMERLVARDILRFFGSSSGNNGDLRLDVFTRFNNYKGELSQSIVNRKPNYKHLTDIFEIKILERINPLNNTTETEILPLSFNEIYDDFNYIPDAIDNFQNTILRYFP